MPQVISKRYKFRLDKYIFNCWIRSSWGSHKKPYWFFDHNLQVLHLELKKCGKTVAFAVPIEHLESSSLGWRGLIARCLLRMRRELKKLTQSTNQKETEI